MLDLTKVKAILMDVDGVLTDGSIVLDGQGEEIKSFYVRDGQLVAFMQSKGILFGAISGRDSFAARKRLADLKYDFIRLGSTNKEIAYAEFKAEFGLDDDSIIFIGDDVIDIPVMSKAGIAVAPSDAAHYVLQHVHWHTKAQGGRGVLREVIDVMIQQRGWDEWAVHRNKMGFRKD
jgi:3-deoxy-D-manno-octulosonate 8-phosphate phosphatase (KDO 8-P phosphatase)